MLRGKLKAGVCEIDLKPEPGMMTGDGAPMAKGTKTPIMARAIVLDNGHTAMAIVAIDVMGIARDDTRRAGELAHERCGIAADAVLTVASHTHVAPSTLPTLHEYAGHFNRYFGAEMVAKEEAWRERLVQGIAEAVATAFEARRPASVGLIATDLPWLVFNRRRHTRDYGVWTHWMGIPKNQAYLPEGPIDPEFQLMVLRDAQHEPMAMLWNFTGHNSFSFGDQFSADIAFTVQEALDNRIGVHIPTLYTPGPSGNTNYFDFQKPYGLEKATDEVASAVVAIYREACTVPEVELEWRKVELKLAQRDTSQYWWKADIAAKMPSWNEYGQKELNRFEAEKREWQTYDTDITVMRIGKTGLVGAPAEFFVEFGIDIKERSPFRHTIVCSYANDYAGYVATRRAFMGGSYEAWPALNARVGREGGYLIVDKAVDVMGQMCAGMTAPGERGR